MYEVDVDDFLGQDFQPVLTNLPLSDARPDLVFVNPSAGAGHAADALPALRAYAVRNCWHVEFRLTASAADLTLQSRTAVEAGYLRLFVLGGDGSFQDLVNATTNHPDVILGILPAGGGNDLADALGLPHDPLQAAKLLRAGQVCQIDAVRAETADGQQRTYIGGGGVGIDAESAFLASTRFRNVTGRFRYLLSAAVALIDTRRVAVRLKWSTKENPDSSLEVEALLVAVLNTPSYGSGLRFAPAAKLNDGLLDLVIVEALSGFELLRALPLLVFFGEVRSRRIKRLQVLQVRIDAPIPCRFHGDGEILGATPVKINVLPGAIRILCPNNSPLSIQ